MSSLSDHLNCTLLALHLYYFLLFFHHPQRFAMQSSAFLFRTPLFH